MWRPGGYLAYVRRPIPQIKATRILSRLAENSDAKWVGDCNTWERGELFQNEDYFPNLAETLPFDESTMRIYALGRALDALQYLSERGSPEGEEDISEVIFSPLDCGQIQFNSRSSWEIPELEEDPPGSKPI